MKLRYLNKSISLNYVEFGITTSLLGTDILTTGNALSQNLFNLPDVTNNVYTTVLSGSYRIEDVGNLEIQNILISLDVSYKGNGSVRCQLSGDEGISWIICSQGDFNTVDFTDDGFLGSGMWISIIQPGNNKFQFRLQTLANVGTVSLGIYDSSEIRLRYRKIILF